MLESYRLKDDLVWKEEKKKNAEISIFDTSSLWRGLHSTSNYFMGLSSYDLLFDITFLAVSAAVLHRHNMQFVVIWSVLGSDHSTPK